VDGKHIFYAALPKICFGARHRGNGNIKMDLKEMGCKGCELNFPDSGEG
jgi:hypothetical protein